ncbi:hypothetical protein [Pseudomonas prosekii]|uniref:hypothetical protein n=1 Tax=Pseudomonas prosekii TaxID=1148509 RepID=UPI0015E825D0|nr:hypothetical protein [Pseudomonas prosekii]
MIAVLILELRIEEKFASQAKRDQKAPSGHCVNIDASVMALSQRNVDFANAQKTVGARLAREGGVSANINVGWQMAFAGKPRS